MFGQGRVGGAIGRVVWCRESGNLGCDCVGVLGNGVKRFGCVVCVVRMGV